MPVLAVDDLINVSDDPGQLGGLGHGRLAVEFFAQFVAALPELFDFHAELFESGEMPASNQG